MVGAENICLHTAAKGRPVHHQILSVHPQVGTVRRQSRIQKSRGSCCHLGSQSRGREEDHFRLTLASQLSKHIALMDGASLGADPENLIRTCQAGQHLGRLFGEHQGADSLFSSQSLSLGNERFHLPVIIIRASAAIDPKITHERPPFPPALPGRSLPGLSNAEAAAWQRDGGRFS